MNSMTSLGRFWKEKRGPGGAMGGGAIGYTKLFQEEEKIIIFDLNLN